MNPDRSRADPEENVLVVDVPDDALERAAAIIRITTINAADRRTSLAAQGLPASFSLPS